MPTMPAGITTVTVTGRYVHPDGSPFTGKVTFAAPSLLQLSGADTIAVGSSTFTLDENGMFTAVLVATDNADMQPTGWAYQVTEQLTGVTARTYWIALPSTNSPIDLADIAPADPARGDYVLVPGPAGPAGADGNTILSGHGIPASTVGRDGDYWMDLDAWVLYGPKTSGAWPGTGLPITDVIQSVNGQTGAVVLDAADVGADPAGAASAAQSAAISAAATDAASKVAAHTAANDPHGDRAWAAARFLTWRRRDLPDPVLADSLYTGTAPTITTAQTTTPTSGYIKYAPPGVALTGTDVTGSFTYAGAGGFQTGTVAPDTNYVLPTSKYPNTYASGQGIWSLEFGTDAQIIQLRFKYISSATMYRLSIDGRKVTDLMQSSGGTTAGSGHMLTIDFGSATPRRIRFDFATMPFGGIYLPPTATLWGAPLQGGRLMVLGDSISDGSAQNTGAGAGTWFQRAARLLGSTDAWEQGRGGTGYITPGSYATFGDRLNADVIAWAPDRLVIWGGYNDNTGSQSAISTAASSLYSTVKTQLPNCQVYVIGCWSPTATPATSIQNTDATLRTAAAAAGFPFISPVTGSCYDASGTLVTTHGPWITSGNAAGYIGADSVHPTDAGHVYLSRRITQAIRALMPA